MIDPLYILGVGLFHGYESHQTHAVTFIPSEPISYPNHYQSSNSPYGFVCMIMIATRWE